MAMRFNTPPNWPTPPEGFVPPAGWQPDPAWGPAPEGWQFWVDDAQPSAAPLGYQIPVANTGAYAQAPTPYAGGDTSPKVQMPAGAVPLTGTMPTAGGPIPPANWQPVDVASAQRQKRPWWFWLLVIGLPILLVLAVIGGIGVVIANTDSTTSSTSSTASASPSEESSDDVGTSADNPADPDTQSFSMFSNDDSYMSGANVTVTIGDANWDASDVKSAISDYHDGDIIVRVPVTIKYVQAGNDDYDLAPFDVIVSYIDANGKTYSSESLLDLSDEILSQGWISEGDSVSGYFTFVLPKKDAKTGVWQVVAFSDVEHAMYMQAK